MEASSDTYGTSLSRGPVGRSVAACLRGVVGCTRASRTPNGRGLRRTEEAETTMPGALDLAWRGLP